MLIFEPVNKDTDIESFCNLANYIWTEFWPSRIGADQTAYMVEQFQSPEALRRDFNLPTDAYEYWFIYADDDKETSHDFPATYNQQGARLIGYTGGHVESDTNRFFVSKIYLLAEERGKGYSKDIISFYVNLCKERKLRAMYLTVNKYNESAIAAYKKAGYSVIESKATDIGNGFVMDDYIMQKDVL